MAIRMPLSEASPIVDNLFRNATKVDEEASRSLYMSWDVSHRTCVSSVRNEKQNLEAHQKD